MKNRNKISIFFLIFTILVTSCSSKDIIIDDFESGNYDKWTVEGEAFGNTPAPYQEDQKKQSNEGGNYYADSFGGNDSLFGTLTSKSFVIERNFINFLIGGGKSDNMYIELLIEGNTVLKSNSLITSGEMNWVAWNVKIYKGKEAQIRIVDNQGGGWGHFMVDEISQSSKSKSVISIDYELSFDVKNNYLLVPIEDNAPELEIQLSANDKNIGVPMYIRVAKSKIDYWIPIDVSDYKGEKVTLKFSLLNKNDVGYSQIKQSDTFGFDSNENFRPLYHFLPEYGWMNDPNGMVFYDGEYHLFYQYNPYGSKWANMHWGHAVSKDLVSWEHLPVALEPDSLGSIFSGSAIIDTENTAGFGKNAMIVIYTSAGKTQTQSIAYSLDKGRTFTKYDQNPVLEDPTIADFRDPKVFWHSESNKWVMSLATQQTITFYGSKNLKQWEKLSEFGEGIGAHSGVWECPDLFSLKYNGKTKWVLFVSINPGGPNGGSATQYFIGDFDGKTFKADKLPYPLWLDYGRDNYAGVTWSNVPESDGRKIFIGWMNNWDYANDVPPIHFSSANTLPRDLKLAHNGTHLVVANPPVKEMLNLRKEKNTFETIKVYKPHLINNLSKGNSGICEIEMTIQPKSSTSFSFELSNSKGEKTKFNFDMAKRIFSVDRSKSGIINFNTTFASKISESPLVKKDKYIIRLFVDKLSIECFINDGELVQTNTIFPTESYHSLEFDADSEINIENLTIYQLKK